MCLHRARVGRPGWLRVRVRDPGDDRRWHLDERRRVRRRLLAAARAGARGDRGGHGLAYARGARPLVPPLAARSTDRSSFARSCGSRPRPPDEIKAAVQELNAQRKAAQPTNRRTFGSVFKNPDHELGAGRMLEACGLKGHPHRRRADLPEARELHRERGGRPHARTRSRSWPRRAGGRASSTASTSCTRSSSSATST